VCGFAGANSEEFDKETPHRVVVFMPEVDPTTMGGTMRLGVRPTHLRARGDGSRSVASQLYGVEDGESVAERHRHRYEVNPEYVERLQSEGLHFTGTGDGGTRMEVVERSDKGFFFAVQYHPEFLSRPLNPSPPFLGFVLAASKQLEGRLPLPKAAGLTEWRFHSDESAAAASSSS
jgi:CTP synthase